MSIANWEKHKIIKRKDSILVTLDIDSMYTGKTAFYKYPDSNRACKNNHQFIRIKSKRKVS